jgi:hypothetical protein
VESAGVNLTKAQGAQFKAVAKVARARRRCSFEPVASSQRSVVLRFGSASDGRVPPSSPPCLPSPADHATPRIAVAFFCAS